MLEASGLRRGRAGRSRSWRSPPAGGRPCRRGRRRRRGPGPPRRRAPRAGLRRAARGRGDLVARATPFARCGPSASGRSARSTRRALRELAREVEAEVLAAGAAPGSIEVRVDEEPEKGTIRAVATGAVGLSTGARPGGRRGRRRAWPRAAAAGFGLPRRAGEYWLAEGSAARRPRVLVLDRFADPAAVVAGEVVSEPEPELWPLPCRRQTRHRGPVTLAPTHLGDRRQPPDGAHLDRCRDDRRRATPPPPPRWWSAEPHSS